MMDILKRDFYHFFNIWVQFYEANKIDIKNILLEEKIKKLKIVFLK